MLGILDEIRMRAKILRERLRQKPEEIEDTVSSLKKLEMDVSDALDILSESDAK